MMDAILALPRVSDRLTRDAYLAALAGLVAETPMLTRSDQVEADIAAIVTWCARRPGRLTALVDAVCQVEPPSAELSRLRALGEVRRPARVLDPVERDLVVELIAGLPMTMVTGLVRDIAERWGRRFSSALKDPVELVALLEDSIPGAGPHPLYVLLVRLAGKVDDERLQPLVEDVRQRTGGTAEAVEPPPTARHYFVVRLAEDGLDASRFLLTVWLVTDSGHWSVRFTGDTAQPLPRIKIELDNQLEQLAQDPVVDIGELTVEFILPRSLLGTDVDQWIVSAPGHAAAIGVHFPVSVRDLTRMRNRIVRTRWRRRCDWLHQHGHLAGGARFEHLNGHQRATFAELLQDPEQPACMVAIGPASQYVSSNIGAWLSAGVPVIVWCREDTVAARFDTHLIGVLNNSGIAELRLAVWRLRQDADRADAAPGHVGRHITLLWDDADWLPPDEHQPLHQPANAF